MRATARNSKLRGGLLARPMLLFAVFGLPLTCLIGIATASALGPDPADVRSIMVACLAVIGFWAVALVIVAAFLARNISWEGGSHRPLEATLGFLIEDHLKEHPGERIAKQQEAVPVGGQGPHPLWDRAVDGF